MNILPHEKRMELLEYMTLLRFRLPDWVSVDISLPDFVEQNLSATEVANLLQEKFRRYEGRVVINSDQDVRMLIEWGQTNSPHILVKHLRMHLHENINDVSVKAASREAMAKIQLRLQAGSAAAINPLYDERLRRKENIILIADDDMYIRMLAKKAVEGIGRVVEVERGDQVVAAYKEHNPDMVLLDIHMPAISGHELLASIQQMDEKAHVIMVSGDSSRENVEQATSHGAKGFLAKPFTREKLLGYAVQCDTVY